VTATTTRLSAKTLGVLAVAGLVTAFSLSSTLVKRAESPGVLVAFWRLIAVSVLWNVALWATARRVTRADVRQVWIPGVFFGLNLAVLFAGATHNSDQSGRRHGVELTVRRRAPAAARGRAWAASSGAWAGTSCARPGASWWPAAGPRG
jgi:hypothetical protein